MRLIDADALKTKAETIQTIDCWHMRTEEQAVLVEHIDNAPTIDAVPVVRCKDCWFGDKCEDRSDLYDCCVGDYNAEHRNAAYGFCYKGKERRDNE